MDLQIVMLVVNGATGLILLLFGIIGKSIVEDLKENTRTTAEIGKNLGALNVAIHEGFATKDSVTRLTDKYEEVLVKIAGLESRVNYGVLTK